MGQGIWNASSELLDRMPPDEIVEQVRELATSFSGVSGVEQLIGGDFDWTLLVLGMGVVACASASVGV